MDVAIVDPLLFQRYCETVLKVTVGFSDLTKFSDGNSKQYSKYIAKGIFRPDLMPASDARRDWFNFFNKLSANYNDLFSDINAGIYFNQTFFEYKQSENIEIIRRSKL